MEYNKNINIGPKKSINKYEREYKNSPVRISCGNQTAGGILDRVEGYTFYLKSGVVYQNVPKDKIGEWNYNPKIRRDKSLMFEVSPPFLVEPLDEGYLEEFVKAYDLWKISEESKSKII